LHSKTKGWLFRIIEVLFAVSFLVVRNVFGVYTTYSAWKDLVPLARNPIPSSKIHPHWNSTNAAPSALYMFFIICTAVFSALNAYWGVQIAVKLVEAIIPRRQTSKSVRAKKRE
jgi:hypothetical protein